MIKINCDICGKEISIEVHNKLAEETPFKNSIQCFLKNMWRELFEYQDLCNDCFIRVESLVLDVNKETEEYYKKLLRDKLTIMTLNNMQHWEGNE